MEKFIDNLSCKIGSWQLAGPRLVIFAVTLTGVLIGLFLQIRHLSEISDSLEGRFYGASSGWISDRVMDLSDMQWREWRAQKGTLGLAMGSFLLVSYAIRTLVHKHQLNPAIHVWFYAIVGVIAGWILHGSGVIWILIFITGNWALTRSLAKTPENVAVSLTWLYNASVLLLVHMGYCQWFSDIHHSLNFLDFHRGMVHWPTYYKMVMLRQISYGIDFQNAIQLRIRNVKQLEVAGKDKPAVFGPEASRRERQETADLSLFGLIPLIAYSMYLPLYLAGPISTFSAFARSCEVRQHRVPMREILTMLAKVAVYWIGLEIYLHYIYVYSLNVTSDWEKYTPGTLSLICYFTLNFMYLKLMIIWRTFRAISLLDGIYTPENMRKCISNSNTFQGFWRAWHASFMEWNVRYIYVPLGGRKHRVLSVWIIFLFVGLWHEIKWNWVAFALFNAFGISVESLVMNWVYKSNQRFISTAPGSWPIRIAEIVFSSFNLTVLIASNFAINQGFEKTFSFVYYAFLQSPAAWWNAVVSISFIILCTVFFYANPWNPAHDINKDSDATPKSTPTTTPVFSPKVKDRELNP